MRKLCTLSALLILISVLSPAASAQSELHGIMQEFIEEHRLSESNFAMGYYNTSTGEYYLYNGDKQFQTGSLYKLPMCMYYAEEIALGNIDGEEKIYGMSFDYVCEQVIRYSSNDVAHMLRAKIGGFRALREGYSRYFTDDAENVPENYYATSIFSAGQCVNILQSLYEGGEMFEGIIEYMRLAQPRQYFRSGRYGEAYDIAQKYGYLDDGYINNMGIIYADSDFLLVVLTFKAPGAATMMGELSDVLIDYTNCEAKRLIEIAEQQTAEAERQQEAAREQEAENQRLQNSERVILVSRTGTELLESLFESEAEEKQYAQMQNSLIYRAETLVLLAAAAVLILSAIMRLGKKPRR